LALTEGPGGACIFLEGDPATCRIQAAKPQQCRDFPFTWRYENIAQVCPAARDRGQTERPA
jgi:Fe-S-cluster containining protein